jgi:hypothetical protein
MAKRNCFNCVYLVEPLPAEGFAEMGARQIIFPVCVNHVDSPGRVRHVHPAEVCRHFRAVGQAPLPRVARSEPPTPERDDIRHIPLTRGLWAVVDAADYQWLSRYRWCVKSGRSGKFYAGRSEGGRFIMMHRQIMQPPPGMVVDHIDGNPLNNRRCNLRICTLAQNARNRRPMPSTSGFVGVYPSRKKWSARITYRGRVLNVGLFDDKVTAAKARDRKARELFGEFAYLNFPEETELGCAACTRRRILYCRGALVARSVAVGVLSLQVSAGLRRAATDAAGKPRGIVSAAVSSEPFGISMSTPRVSAGRWW